jgi:hypothetical protein
VSAWQWVVLPILAVVLICWIAYGLLGDEPGIHIVMSVLIVGSAAAMVIFIPLANHEHDRWVAWCKDQGGHVTDHTSTNVVSTVGADGKPGMGVSSETTYYCLTADGRVLDVQ